MSLVLQLKSQGDVEKLVEWFRELGFRGMEAGSLGRDGWVHLSKPKELPPPFTWEPMDVRVIRTHGHYELVDRVRELVGWLRELDIPAEFRMEYHLVIPSCETAKLQEKLKEVEK